MPIIDKVSGSDKQKLRDIVAQQTSKGKAHTHRYRNQHQQQNPPHFSTQIEEESLRLNSSKLTVSIRDTNAYQSRTKDHHIKPSSSKKQKHPSDKAAKNLDVGRHSALETQDGGGGRQSELSIIKGGNTRGGVPTKTFRNLANSIVGTTSSNQVKLTQKSRNLMQGLSVV